MSRPRSEPVRLVLAGAGHAHLEVLRRLAEERPAGVEVTVVSAEPRHFYSGMVPGLVAGQYGEGEIAFELRPLVERAGGRFVVERVTGVEAAARRLRLAGGGEIDYDLVSFNLGSSPSAAGVPGAREHATSIKPLSRALELRRRLRALAAEGRGRVVVVGAGAAGVEIALAAAAVLGAGEGEGRVALVEAADAILAGYPPRFRARAEAVLARRGVRVLTGSPVARVEPERLALADGRELPARLALWLVGAAAPEAFDGSGLPLDPRGFLLVNDRLRSPGDPAVFGVGDCATLAEHPETPKAGVYSVRQGPVVAAGLVAAIRGGRGPRYRPQRGFLSILNTGDGRALLAYKCLVVYGRSAWRLKDRIDRRFMRRYQSLYAG